MPPSTLPHAAPLTAGDIEWNLDPRSPWPDEDRIVTAALRSLELVDDELAARVILALLEAVSDLRSRLASQQLLITVGLEKWHTHVRSDHRLRRMREARRREKRVRR